MINYNFNRLRPLMSLIANYQMAKSKNINIRNSNQYPSSSISKKTDSIISSQGYDNYYGKASVQKEAKNILSNNAGYSYGTQNINK